MCSMSIVLGRRSSRRLANIEDFDLIRTAEQFEVALSRPVVNAGYGSAEMSGSLVSERGIDPHVKLLDKSGRIMLRQSGLSSDREGR
jgi:hypothetical protein